MTGPRRSAVWPGLAVALAAAGLAIAGYLTIVRLSGGLPACGPLEGCDQVASSPYSEVFGIPVAALGLGFSSIVLASLLAWWRTGSRRAAVVAYGMGLVGVLVVAYLTYLELFVIHAICAWCVAYGLTVILGWAITAVGLRVEASRI